MAEVREQLRKMLRIQQLVLDSQNARSIVESGPGRIEEIEGHFRERNAEYVALRERHDALEADRQARSLELKTLEEDRRKFMDSLMQVKNQREYAAVLKEIDAVKARISENEETVLKAMEEIETLKGELDTHASHIETERAQVAEEHAGVDAAVEAARQALDRAEAERADVEKGLPRELVAAIRRVEEGRRGLFLVKCEREMCTACHVRIRPQVYSEIRQATKLHICSNCKRFLYWERAVVDLGEHAPPPGVEALNGGAL